MKSMDDKDKDDDKNVPKFRLLKKIVRSYQKNAQVS